MNCNGPMKYYTLNQESSTSSSSMLGARDLRHVGSHLSSGSESLFSLESLDTWTSFSSGPREPSEQRSAWPRRETKEEWGMETVRSWDSGIGSLLGGDTEDDTRTEVTDLEDTEAGDSTPDLLDCCIQEDIEERIRMIRSGTAKASEMTVFRNLMALLNFQQQSYDNHSSEVAVTKPASVPASVPPRRAIVGVGAKEGTKVTVGTGQSYYQDLQKLSSLLEQDCPIVFPGQQNVPPVTVKMSPSQHPPAVDIATVTKDTKETSLPTIPEVVKTKRSPLAPLDMNVSGPRRPRGCEQPKQVVQRVEEGYYQLRELAQERRELERAMKLGAKAGQGQQKVIGKDNRTFKLGPFLEECKEERRALENLLGQTKKGISSKKHLSMLRSLVDLVHTWSASITQLVTLHNAAGSGARSRDSELVAEGLRQVNKETRRIRSLMWTVYSSSPDKYFQF